MSRYSRRTSGIKVRLVILLAALQLIALLSSCDPFMLGPSPRANWDDPDIALINLKADVYGNETIRLAWDWIDLERVLNGIDPVVDKISINHSRGIPPLSRIGGKTYNIDDFDPEVNTLWNHVFSDLKYDSEHYFALYMHEKGGRWLAPLYGSTYMDNVEERSANGVRWHDIDGIDSVNKVFVDPPTDPNNVDAQYWDIYYFDAHEYNRAVKTASLTFLPNQTGTFTLVFHPLRFRSGNVSDYLGPAVDRTVRMEKTVSLTNGVAKEIDVTEIGQKAFYHSSGGIVMYSTTAGGLDLNYEPSLDEFYPRLSYTWVETN